MGRRRKPLGWLLAALLGASFLTSGFPPTRAQISKPDIITITWEPLKPFVGGEVTLTPGGEPDFASCSWSRQRSGEYQVIFVYFPQPNPRQLPGPAYTERETAGPKCTLHIKNLTLEDSGMYLVSKERTGSQSEVGEADIKVHARRIGSKGAIAGITVGAVAGALLIGVLF